MSKERFTRPFLWLIDKPGLMVGAIILAGFAILTVGAPWIIPYSIYEPSCGVFEPPSAAHWFGCDDGGIDVLSLTIYGGRISIMVGVAASLIAIGVGALVGILAGYFGGLVDTVLMGITDYLLVIPQIVLMIVVASVWSPSIDHVVLVIGLLMWTSVARLIRSQVKSMRQRVFVRRAEANGPGICTSSCGTFSRRSGRCLPPTGCWPSRWRSSTRPRSPFSACRIPMS